MRDAVLDSPAAEFDNVLAEVPEAVASTGYPDFLSCMLPHAVRAAAWHQSAELVDGETRRVVGLFLLGERQPVPDLPAAVQDVLPVLTRVGVAHIDDEGNVRLSGLALLFVRGIWLFAQPPQISPTLYLGDDSLALADRLALRPGSCLDLCAGPGIQTLLCAQRGHPVTAVEVNPVAAALCRVNAGLNGLSGRVSVHCGDLYGAIGGGKFDNITANPPLIPIPAAASYPFVGDGGPDGLRTVRRILDGLPGHLSEGGQAQLIGMALSDGMLPCMLDEMADYAQRDGMDVTVTVTAHLAATAGADWARGIAQTVSLHSGTPYEDAEEAVASGYQALGATHVCTYALRIRRGNGSLKYIDLSPETGSGLWFV